MGRMFLRCRDNPAAQISGLEPTLRRRRSLMSDAVALPPSQTRKINAGRLLVTYPWTSVGPTSAAHMGRLRVVTW
jgi:hypothetical protein